MISETMAARGRLLGHVGRPLSGLSPCGKELIPIHNPKKQTSFACHIWYVMIAGTQTKLGSNLAPEFSKFDMCCILSIKTGQKSHTKGISFLCVIYGAHGQTFGVSRHRGAEIQVNFLKVANLSHYPNRGSGHFQCYGRKQDERHVIC